MISRFRRPMHAQAQRDWRRCLLLPAGILLLAPAGAGANPTGGNVAAGSAKIAGQGSSTVTVTQASNLAVINWQSFSINSGETTSFLQPSANSAALNRVLGGQTSLINGTLTANGQVYLVNGNGIIVGPGGVINANAFTASTRDITDADFLSGTLHFTGSSSAGVQNLGTIHALGGNVVLIGRTVDNEGTITAPNGTAALVAGDDVLLAQQNADGSTVTVSPVTTAPSTPGQVGVNNGGTITAAAAELKAANGNIYALAVQNQGTIRATTVSHQGGHIWLTSDSGAVKNSGTVDASATAAGGKGGTITLKSATGTASHTGQIIAKGGQGGAGGNAEISGAQVQFSGTVDLSAPNGLKGNLLIDPATIDIVNGGGANLTASTIDPSAIVAALNTTNVTLTGTTSITVDDIIDASANPNPGNLTLTTPVLNLNAGIMLNGSLSSGAGLVNMGPGGFVQNAIDAVGGGGTVNLAGGAVYTLSNEIVINKDVDLEGNGATLSGGGSTRVMEIDSGNVTLNNLVVQGGNGNSSAGAAGASWNGDGGGLLVFGAGVSANVFINNSTFVGNSCNDGGAIFSVIISGGSHSVIMENSTFTANSAILGSALYNYGSFGGNASMAMKEDTIVGNSGTGAIYTTVLSSGNASITINESILAGNTAFSGESEYVDGGGGTLNDIGFNLYGQNGNAGGFVPAGPGDILLGGGISSVVAPLSNYGGLTPTMALVQGSPALEAGDPAFDESPDQRGFARADATSFTGSAPDIGAYEAQYVSVQADPIGVVYGSTPVFTYTVTSGPATAIASLTGTLALISPATNVGTYGEDIGQGTLMAAPLYIVDFTDGDLTITPRPVTVNPDPGQGKVYGMPDPSLTYTTAPADATSGLVNGDTLSGSPSYVGASQFAGAGTYPTNLGTLSSSSNYTVALSAVAPTFAVTQRVVVVDPDPGQGKIYGTPDPALTFTLDPATATTGLVNGDVLAGSLTYPGAGQFTDAGVYPIIAGTLSNSNYVVSVAPAPFLISPRIVELEPAPGQGKLYGTPDPALAFFLDPADATTGLVNGDTLSGSPSYTGAGQFAGAGVHAITAGTLSNVNYVVSVNPKSFTIAPRLVVVDPDSGQTKVFGTVDPFLSYTTDPATSTTGLVNGDTLRGSPSYNGAGQFAPAGVYPTNLGSLANGNYVLTLSDTAPTFTITKLSSSGAPGFGSGSGGATDPAQPNMPVSQAIGQNTQPPNNPVGPGPTGPTGPDPDPSTPQPPQPPNPPDNPSQIGISPNETMDGSQGDSSANGTSAGGGLAQGSSYNTPGPGGPNGANGPNAAGPATMVAPGQTIALAGGLAANGPPPAPVQTAFDQGFSHESLTTLASAAKASGGPGAPGGPNAAGPATMVAPGQTIALAGGVTASGPPPAPVQTAFDQGFSHESLSTLASAAKATGPAGKPGGPGAAGPAATVAPGQTVTVSHGKAANIPLPPAAQAAFKQGLSDETHDTLSQALLSH